MDGSDLCFIQTLEAQGNEITAQISYLHKETEEERQGPVQEFLALVGSVYKESTIGSEWEMVTKHYQRDWISVGGCTPRDPELLKSIPAELVADDDSDDDDDG